MNESNKSTDSSDESSDTINPEVFRTCTKKLSPKEAHNILANFDPATYTHVNRITNARPGQIYIFYTNNAKLFDDYTTDNFSWSNNGALKPQPANDPIVLKTYSKAKNNSGKLADEFQKHYWHLIDTEKASNKELPKAVPVLIHYLGDSRNCKPAPHGNFKNVEVRDNLPSHQRTLPSILNAMKEKLTKTQTASHILYKEASQDEKPRNLKQVQYAKMCVNKNKRFRYDEFANCHLMHLSMNFPNMILSAPDVRIVAVDLVLLKESLKVIKSSKKLVNLQYDTTFNLTGLYVSVITMIHPFLQNSAKRSVPVPLIYHFHERKTLAAHTYFFNFIKEVNIPKINNMFVKLNNFRLAPI